MRDLHEYNALKAAGRILTEVIPEVKNPRLTPRLQQCLQGIERRAAIVYTGAVEGWNVAKNMNGTTSGTFLERWSTTIVGVIIRPAGL